jgi:hypothetical protein
VANGLPTEQAIVENDAVINGADPGRASAQEITLSTEVGLQDLVVVSAAVEKSIDIDIDFWRAGRQTIFSPGTCVRAPPSTEACQVSTHAY